MNADMKKSLCILSTRAPYVGQMAREALDAALVSASYEIETSLLLMGDGVYQVLNEQNPGDLPRKSLLAMLSALPMYGVETVYVDQASLEERGVSEASLHGIATVIPANEVPAFIKNHSRVLNF